MKTKGKLMKSTRQITVEHMVIASSQSYEKVLEELENQLGSEEGWRETEQHLQALAAAQAPWEQVAETIQRQLGTSDLTIFKTVEHPPLHHIAGRTSRAVQYVAGNPLLAYQMSELLPEVALYAPLHFVVYEDEAGKTFIAYDTIGPVSARGSHPGSAGGGAKGGSTSHCSDTVTKFEEREPCQRKAEKNESHLLRALWGACPCAHGSGMSSS